MWNIHLQNALLYKGMLVCQIKQHAGQRKMLQSLPGENSSTLMKSIMELSFQYGRHFQNTSSNENETLMKCKSCDKPATDWNDKVLPTQTVQKTSQNVLETQGFPGFQSGLRESKCNWECISCTTHVLTMKQEINKDSVFLALCLQM